MAAFLNHAHLFLLLVAVFVLFFLVEGFYFAFGMELFTFFDALDVGLLLLLVHKWSIT